MPLLISMLIGVREIIPVGACVSSFDLEEDMLSILLALPDPDNEKVRGLESKASKVLKCLNVSAERTAEILAANETLLRLQNEYDNKKNEFNSSQLIYNGAKAKRVDAEVSRNRAMISLLKDRKLKRSHASMCNWSVERLEESISESKVGTYAYVRGLFSLAKEREKTAEDNFDRAKMDMDLTESVLKESMSDFLCTNQVHDCCTKSYQMYED
ncbi:hypothetical protein Ddc_15577 [Ditylenchus destructor]|nr:hypothetical protein Ddc_15577 [Ditylenchus destructor]